MTRDNFEAVLPKVQAALQQCLFYAFDCEFSGLSAGGKPLDYLASLQERYTRVSLLLPVGYFVHAMRP